MQNKIALITGGGRGIGAATAKLFREKGATVIATSRSKDELTELEKLGIHTFVADLSRSSEIHKLFAHITAKFTRLDILVNNAGAFKKGAYYELSEEDFRSVLAINLDAPFLCSKLSFPLMKNEGAIVNISSLAGILNVQKFPGFSSYSAAKAGLVGLTEAMAAEGMPHGIRVNAIAPGAVATRLQAEASPFLKPGAEPLDIAKIIYFLADNEQSGIMSGTIIPVYSNA